MKMVLWILCIVYCACPVDLFPGPVDDAIVAVAVYGLTKFIGPGNGNNNRNNGGYIN